MQTLAESSNGKWPLLVETVSTEFGVRIQQLLAWSWVVIPGVLIHDRMHQLPHHPPIFKLKLGYSVGHRLLG